MTVARGLEQRLVSSGALRKEAVQMARRRQKVYGGGFDTVLLEMGLVDEGTLWALLVEESGIPPLPPALLDGPLVQPDLLIGAAEARRLGAFMFAESGREGSAPQVVARPGFDGEALSAALEGEPADIFIVPEVRFEALLGAYYGQPIPPRFLSLLGRLMGAEQVRRWAAAHAPRPQPVAPPVDVGPRVVPLTKPDVAPPPEPTVATLTATPFDDAQLPAAHAATPEDGGATSQTPAAAPEADEVEAAIDRIARAAGPSHRAHADELLAALELLGDLEGGPRSPTLAAAITERWSCAEIFSRLPQLARRGEHAARAALPLLSTHAEDAHLLLQWLAAENPRERMWAALALEPFVRMSSSRADGAHVTTATAQLVRTALCGRIERETDADAALALARALRPVCAHGDVQALLRRLGAVVTDSAALDPVRAHAAALVGRLRPDMAAGIEPLIAGVAAKSPHVSDTCHGLLVRITGWSAGKSRRAWERWWQQNQHHSRLTWLVDGLSHKEPEVRMVAAHELWELTGQTLGYHFDLPPGPRKAAAARWKQWLERAETAPEAR